MDIIYLHDHFFAHAQKLNKKTTVNHNVRAKTADS